MSSGWELEKSEVEMLLDLQRETEAACTDAKAEALLELDLQAAAGRRRPGAEGADLHRAAQCRRCWPIFWRAVASTTLNGSMDLETRTVRSRRSPRRCAC